MGFSLSLTPSLLPRDELLQGIIAGLSLAIGYAFGVLLQTGWHYLQLPVLPTRYRLAANRAVILISLMIASLFVWQFAHWQNSVRAVMGMSAITIEQTLLATALALTLATVLLILARLLNRLWLVLVRYLQPFIPTPTAQLLSILILLGGFGLLANDILLEGLLQAVDTSYQQIDALLDDEVPLPSHSLQTGGPESLLDWHKLGRQGRKFIASGPTAERITALTGKPAKAPLRVYVGLNAADTPQARAQLALAELQRIHAFERSILLVITPTGTGWVDPAGVDTVEYLQGGDIASVALQYSYLSSPFALWMQADYGAESARALFDAVYGYWRSLPKNQRPRLYLYGLSLGARNSDLSFELFDIIDDPPDGVLWSGPPFGMETWRTLTRKRNPESPAWLPHFRNGSVIRFMNQYTHPDLDASNWRGFRMIFLQYASDPVTFFEPAVFYRQPDWMDEPRGPDVSPALRWFPVITGLQLAADMVASAEPPGYGHEYAPEHYLNAWATLLTPPGWTPEQLQQLQTALKRYPSGREGSIP